MLRLPSRSPLRTRSRRCRPAAAAAASTGPSAPASCHRQATPRRWTPRLSDHRSACTAGYGRCAAPKDWRGVFDAIDTGNWAAAQAGIAALPPGMLTPVAKAELYTAKGSPVVDLASLQALIAQAPELPQANQLALMALRRGAAHAAADHSARRRRQSRLGARPLPRPAGSGRARRRPAARGLDPLIKVDDADGAEAGASPRAGNVGRGAGRSRSRVALIYYVLGLDMDARRVADTWRHGATGAGRANRPGSRGSRRGGSATSTPHRPASGKSRALAEQRELRAGA